MDERLRQTVRERADHRCEYCCLPQNAEPFFAYHVEHIVARQHGGRDDSENLALACYHCKLFEARIGTEKIPRRNRN
jgi:5-methylcytosine-specific restriction endonuclease McrA